MEPAQELIRENQEKVDFFLVSAHELRTSLTAMKWIFKMLVDGDYGTLTKTQSAMITQAANANERMVGLINDTMTVIRTQGASISYVALPVSISNLIEESIKDFTSEAAMKGMHIRYIAPATEMIVIGDAEKLRIVIHNLFENAIKYGDKDTDISISLSIKDSSAVFEIKDYGIVIPPKEQSSIFQKFFRASNTREAFIGVGLGLYATKHIVERHGGTLTFTSDDTSGTLFILTIPLG